MTNNDIFRRLRYCFNLKDHQLIATFAAADLLVTKEQLLDWLKKEDEPGFINMPDQKFAYFLDGFINQKRGKRDDKQRPPEKKLTNNIILNKLKIALNLKAEDIIELLAGINFNLSKPELSAMFRKPEHKHFRECKDQLMRNFLNALQHQFSTPNTKQEKPSQVVEKKSSEHSKKTAKIAIRYDNPKVVDTKKEKSTVKRKTLKLKPSDIWQDHHK